MTNIDETARRANALRDEPFVRCETLSYRGVHMVDAFIIRKADNMLAGMSNPFYVVIEQCLLATSNSASMDDGAAWPLVAQFGDTLLPTSPPTQKNSQPFSASSRQSHLPRLGGHSGLEIRPLR